MSSIIFHFSISNKLKGFSFYKSRLLHCVGDEKFAYISPMYEFVFLFFTLYVDLLFLKRKTNIPIEPDDDRFYQKYSLELEKKLELYKNAIIKHKRSIPMSQSMDVDRNLWKILD